MLAHLISGVLERKHWCFKEKVESNMLQVILLFLYLTCGQQLFLFYFKYIYIYIHYFYAFKLDGFFSLILRIEHQRIMLLQSN